MSKFSIAARSRRRHDFQRMKQRMLHLGARVWSVDERMLSERWLGNMVSTHGKPCSCALGCGNRRKHHGPPIRDRRQLSEPVAL